MALYPTDSAYANLGWAYIRKGDDKNALFALNKAIELNPDATQYHYNRALAYYQKAAYEQPVADFTTVISKETQHALAYRQRGNLYIYMNQPALAVVDLTKARETGPRDAESYAARGPASYRQGGSYIVKRIKNSWRRLILEKRQP
ncbi:tetratricopeptide repeat protein [Chitinophaga sp. 22308]|uniref:tetratricopeptide repeat protein n=1 Tax=Chitinophaga sp. 22308 TaxID=3453906 RepID=UPI003F871181